MSKELTQHFLSAAWPPMPQEDWEAFREDIEVNGQRMPIVLYEGQILDGWQRYKCLLELHREPDVIELAEGDDPRAFVTSANNHRRHSTASQRAMAQVEMSKWKPRGKPAPGADSKSAAEMASAGNISVRTIERAKEVSTKGSPELVAAIKAGKLSVKTAAEALKPKKPKPPKPIISKLNGETEEHDKDNAKEVAREMVELDKENKELQRLNKSLSASDAGKEIAEITHKYDAQLGRNLQLNAENCEMKKGLAYRDRLLASIRKLLGVEENSKIVAAIMAMKKAPNEF